jgi:hypothetical protein
MHVGAALDKLFSEVADGHAVNVYGDASPRLVEMGNAQMGDRIRWYCFLQGLES